MDAGGFQEMKEKKIERSQTLDKEVKSKDTSKLVAIQYKNEASPIKDQKDILKEKERTLSPNKVNFAHYEQEREDVCCDKKEEESEGNKTPEDCNGYDKAQNEYHK